MGHHITLQRATENWQRAAAYYVRVESMINDLHLSLKGEFEEDLPDTLYVVAFDNEAPVGTCRVVFHEAEGLGKIERVVVKKEYRQQGIGRLMIEESERWIKEQGFSKVVINSRDAAVGFYEKLGYTIEPEKSFQGKVYLNIPTYKLI